MRLNSQDTIIRIADNLVKKYETRNAEALAGALGIRIYYVPLKRQKGMYKIIKRLRCIFVNSNLSDYMRSIVILHEIGHDQLHRKQASAFHEFQLFDMSTSEMEYEANLFAAQISLPDEDVIEYISNGYSADMIAGSMNSDINLVAIKAADLSRRGYAFRLQDYRSNFLK